MLIKLELQALDFNDGLYKSLRLSTHNACITRLLLCRLSLNLPLNTVNPKKPRMPNVANRVDAIVMFY
ncbi:hypothetical protein A6E03_16940 [Aliivibrio sp. 1S128]|nr:hypothetical protein A6E03_16940 [Aliivibrio sp. 1S128]